MVTPATLRIELLGGFVVHRGTVCIPGCAWRLRKAGHVVKLLALAPGHRLHRDVIVDILWPEFAPRRAANNLHRTLSEARCILDPHRPARMRSSFLNLQANLIELSADVPVEVDVQTFRAAANEARRHPTPERYEAALALYRDDLLPEDRFDDWAIGPREELRGLRLALLLGLAAVRTGRTEYQAAIEALLTAVAVDPTHEEAQTALIRRYAAIGRRGEAIRQFERFRNALRRELGVDPPDALGRFVRDLARGTEGSSRPATDGPDGDGWWAQDEQRGWSSHGGE